MYLRVNLLKPGPRLMKKKIKKLERYLRVNLLKPGPRFMKKKNLKIGNVFASKSVETGPSSYKKKMYRAAVSQRLRNTGMYRIDIS